MIKNIYGNSNWISVGDSGSSMPYMNITQPMAGMLRCNPSMNRMEVYDGNNWHGMGGDANIDLSENAKQILMWAQEKMREEFRIKELIAKHPGLKDLKDKFEMMKVLCMEEEKKENV